jgi:plasmid stability protein
MGEFSTCAARVALMRATGTFKCMKRTTLLLDEDLLAQLKAMAAREGTSLQSLVNGLLKRALAGPKKGEPYRLQLEGWDAATQSGVDLLDRDKLFDLMDGRS